jgi:hypothetical protein
MKNPTKIRRPTSLHGTTRVLAAADPPRKMRSLISLSRWRALGREQFRVLIAAPQRQHRSKGGSNSW